ncbi:VIT domain-containing protein [Sphingomonas sp.]|uniref:VIT domain-containing protein n=1 Tax=Sphingomonas sp. TaxID=28214 RepID=UPI001B269FF2|nr:VIT domain-containing protein [Sphingomonas sp.]MBO9713375.1 hypothetical protein [Sphingomonas sp.]
MKACWLLATAALALAPAAAFAQGGANPGLTAQVGGVDDEQHAAELKLRRLDVAVAVRGGIAETVVTASFLNPGEDRLQGDFRLRLPEGAVVTGYALDIDGRLVDGVLVDQPKAKAVYEERVRQKVDPGMAEVTAGGEFRTRVFPILPDKGRTIRIRFVAPLLAPSASDEIYRLPLDLGAPSEGWSITVRASGDLPEPALAWPGRGVAPMVREGQDLVARGEGRTALVGALTIARQPFAALLSRNGYGERSVQLSGDTGPAGAPAPVESVRIYWDRSRARRDARHAAELALLRHTLAALAPRSIEVVTFNSNGAQRSRVGSADVAIALLEKVQYRGATSYAALGEDRAAADRCLLFSGGRPQLDRGFTLRARCRLDAVTSAPVADLAWLRNLAKRHGGRAFALGSDASAIEKALAARDSGVTGVFDAAGQALPYTALEGRSGRWMVVARAPASGGVTVHVGGRDVTLAVPEIAVAFDGEGVLLASDTLTGLDPTVQRADYVALSRRYGVASPDLSFVVLETPSDYARADVDPPKDYPEEQLAEWREMRKGADDEKAEAKAERLGVVAERWAEQVKWWETRFDPDARPKKPKEAPAPSPPPPATVVPPPAPEPTPMPTAEPAPDQDGGEAEVVVTGVRAAPQVSMVANAVTSIDAEDVGKLPDSDPSATIELEAWQPTREYLKAFDAAPATFDKRFVEVEEKQGAAPAFYFDTAEWLRRHGKPEAAREMLLSALDLPVANSETIAIVAARLERYGDLDHAIELRERLAALESERPQPRRLLALALARRAALRPATARADLERAVKLLTEVIMTPWDDAWDGVEMVSLMEVNTLIPRLIALGGKAELDPRLVRKLDVDLRVVVDWDTDATDLDLWVDEPNGERAIYSNQRTAIGGHLSDDMTDGYGPEEYLLRRAPDGTYVVQADVYRLDAINPNGPSVITAHLIRDFGRPTEREESVDIELTDGDKGRGQDARLIGRLVVGKKK